MYYNPNHDYVIECKLDKVLADIQVIKKLVNAIVMKWN
jgi:hypothetical protein